MEEGEKMKVRINCTQGMAIVEAKSLRQAEAYGRWYYGNRDYVSVQKPDKEDAEWFIAMNGVEKDIREWKKGKE